MKTGRGFTLFELLFFVFMISLGVGTSLLFHAYFGPKTLAGLWAGILGFVLGVGFLPFLGFSHYRYRKWAYLGDKWMPDCACGSDRIKFEKVQGHYRLVCQNCHAIYEKRRDEVWVFNGAEKQPYKRLVRFKGWI